MIGKAELLCIRVEEDDIILPRVISPISEFTYSDHTTHVKSTPKNIFVFDSIYLNDILPICCLPSETKIESINVLTTFSRVIIF